MAYMFKPKVIFLPYKLHFRFFLFALAERLPVTVFLPPEKTLPDQTKIKGVKINYLQFGADKIKRLIGKEVRTLKYVVNLRKLLDQQSAQVLITCEFYHWYTLQCLAYKKNNPALKLFVVSETKRWPNNILAYLIKRIIFFYFKANAKYIDGMLVYTEQAKNFLNKYLPSVNVTILPAPIDTNRFYPRLGNKEFLRDGKLRLLMNARFSPYKRHKDLFLALRQLNQEKLPIKLTCISRDDKNKDEIIELAKTCNIANLVDFVDALPYEQMLALYHEHDVLVLPSYNEAIGMVVPEAMACGLPTITSDTVGANVYVKNKDTGFIFKTGDIDDLASAIKQCFEIDLLNKMGKQANQHIISNFTPQAVVDKFIPLIMKNY